MATTYTITWPAVVDQGTGPGTPAGFTLTLDSPGVSTSTFSVTDGSSGGTFLPSASPSIPAGQLSVSFTYKPSASTVDRSITISVTNFAALAQPVPASRSFIVTAFGYYRPVWEANLGAMATSTRWLARGAPAPLPPVPETSSTLIYDPQACFEAIIRLTGDVATYGPCSDIASYLHRDAFVIRNGGISRDFENWSHGIRDHWVRTGDPRSLAACGIMSRNGLYSTDGISPTATLGSFSNSRPCSQSIMSYLDAEDCGCARRAKLDGNGTDNHVNVALGHLKQWLTPEASWPQCQFMQPFMVGLTLRSLIAYWDRYGNSVGPTNLNNLGSTLPGGVGTMGATIPAVVKQVLDMLWAGSIAGIPFWLPDQHNPGFGLPTIYSLGPVGTGTFGYAYPDYRTQPTSCTIPWQFGTYPYPGASLNNFLAPAYHWYYLFSGDDTYRRRGDAVFCGSMACVANRFDVNAQKEWNQCYLWSPQGVGWRDRAITPPPAATALVLTAPSPASGRANEPSGAFAVSIAPGTALSGPVTVTPSVSGGGRSIPPTLILSPDRPAQAFRAVPAFGSAGGPVSVGVAAAGGVLTAPAPASYSVVSVATLATGYSVTAPAFANPTNFASLPFGLALVPPGSVPGPAADARGGVVDVTSFDGYRSGRYDPGGTPPVGYHWLAAFHTTDPFTYTPILSGDATIVPTNSVGYSDAGNSIVYPGTLPLAAATPAPGTLTLTVGPSGIGTITIAVGP